MDLATHCPELALGSSGSERNQFGYWLRAPGNRDLLPGLGAKQELGQCRFSGVYGYGGHAAILANQG